MLRTFASRCARHCNFALHEQLYSNSNHFFMLSFSIANQAAWAPGVVTSAAWREWAIAPFPLSSQEEPPVQAMPAMLRRRAGFLGKMALEVAYDCLQGRTGIPTVFCSRHGEAARAVTLLTDLACEVPLSPAGFGLAVHNASAGLFSIARGDRANHLALAAGAATVEHAVIEACGLLADGAPSVLLVSYDNCLPPVFARFADCAEQPHAWAWLMVPAAADPIGLQWRIDASKAAIDAGDLPGSLEILRFSLGAETVLERRANRRLWRWTRSA